MLLTDALIVMFKTWEKILRFIAGLAWLCYMAVVVKTDGIPCWGIGAPPILEPILVGMFTGGTGF